MQEYKIYYFGKTKLNPSPLVEQTQWSGESFEKCMQGMTLDIPTLVYIEDLELANYVEIGKLFLRLKDEGKIYPNLTIYNKTTSAHKTIFQLPIFKKVLNIFPFDKIISICSNSVINALGYINKTISVVFNPSQPPESCYTLIKAKGEKYIDVFVGQKGGDSPSAFEQIFNFRIMETNGVDDLEQTWWYKYYFSIPPCAHGRLSQSSGTCWLNTVLNTLFLTQPIAEMLVQKYKTLDNNLITQVEQIELFLDIVAKDFPLKVILWSMVRLLLIQKKKPITLDRNFMGVIAAKVKSLHEFGNENYWLENNLGVDYGSSYNAANIIGIVLSFMLENTEDYFVLFNIWSLDHSTRKQLFKEYDEYEELKNTFDETNRDYFIQLEEKVNSFLDLQNHTYSLVKKMGEEDLLNTFKWSELIVKNDHLNLFKNLNSSNPPKILIIPTFGIQVKNIPEIIYIDDTEYKLNAVSLIFKMPELDSAHVVSGLVCGAKYYIYDSNNILTYDSWNKGVYNNYIDALNEFYQVNGFAYEYTQNCLVYIRT